MPKSSTSLPREIADAVHGMSRVDTHGHLRSPISDLESAAHPPEELDSLAAPFNARATAVGCEALHGIDVGCVLRTDAPAELFEKAAALRALGRRRAFDRAFRLANIECQLCFCDWRLADAEDKLSIAPHVRLLAYIDQAILGTPQDGEPYLAGLERLHGRLTGLDDLLAAVDRAVDSWPAGGVVGMKVSLAYYGHGLALKTPTRREAEQAFARGNDMSPDEAGTVRDCALLHAFAACRRNGLAVVIHTGMLAFGQAMITNTNPAAMQHVLQDQQWSDLTFVLLHGGYPYTGETGYLASRLPNVVIDFTWLSWYSVTRFQQALAEWLEVVPLSRFIWGSDSGPLPESIAGIDALSRQSIARTLEHSLKVGGLDPARALRFVELAYRENARRVFPNLP